jgi:ATP-dependent Clp protease ATP-binding subunit ClpA
VEEVRAQVARVVGQGDEVTTGQIPFTPRAKKVLELALKEALSLGHNYIGTEHILLGLVRENEGVAARVLLDFDADAEKIRNEIIRMLTGPRRGHPVTPPPPIREGPLISIIEYVRAAKEDAIEAQDFDRAATLRDLERELTAAARKLKELLPPAKDKWEYRIVELAGAPETWAEQLEALTTDDWSLVSVSSSHAILERASLGPAC